MNETTDTFLEKLIFEKRIIYLFEECHDGTHYICVSQSHSKTFCKNSFKKNSQEFSF